MLVLDDAQWCDGASLRFLAYLARRLEAVPVLIVATVRTTGGEPHQEDLLAELELEPKRRSSGRVPCRSRRRPSWCSAPLDAQPADRFTAACHQTTSGNPLLLSQLLRALASGPVPPDAAHADRVVALGSRAISSTVLMRLRRLPEEVVDVARAAAVLGDGARLAGGGRARRTAGGPHRRRARRAGPRRDRVRPAAAGIRPPTRARRDLPGAACRRAGAAPRARSGGPPGLAGERRAGGGAPAADSPTRGRGRGQTSVYGVAGGGRPGRVGERGHLPAQGTRGVAEQSGQAGSGAEAGSARSSTRRRRPGSSTSCRPTRCTTTRACAPRSRSRPRPPMCSPVRRASPPRSPARRRHGLPDELTDQRQALIALQRISGFMHCTRGRLADPGPGAGGQRARCADAGRDDRAAGDPGRGRPGAGHRAGALRTRRRPPVRGRRRACSGSTPLRFARSPTTTSGTSGAARGPPGTRADRCSRRCPPACGRASGSGGGASCTRPWPVCAMPSSRTACGAAPDSVSRSLGGSRSSVISTAGTSLQRAGPPTRCSAGPLFGESGRVYQQALAQLLVVEGRCEEALAVLDAAPEGIVIANPAWNPWRSITAAALHGLGRTAEALSVAEEEVALLRRWGAPSYLGRGLYLLGQLRGGRRARPPAGVGAAARHDTGCGGPRTRPVRARQAGPRSGDDEAIPLLLDASRTAGQRGAHRVRDLARAELERRGHPVEALDEEVRTLSSTERQILDLTARGLDVHEVAQRLFVTPGTVRAVLDEVGSDGVGHRLRFFSSGRSR